MPFRPVKLVRARHPLRLAAVLAGNTAGQRRTVPQHVYQPAVADLYEWHGNYSVLKKSKNLTKPKVLAAC